MENTKVAVTIPNHEVVPGDKVVILFAGQHSFHLVTSVYCMFWHRNGPDAHIVIEYEDRYGLYESINNPRKGCGKEINKYGREVEVIRAP